MKKITLYIKASCPYCKKVLSALEELGKEVEIKDISHNQKLEKELIDIGGKKQVPCIVIDGEAKYESQDIITWLISHQDLY